MQDADMVVRKIAAILIKSNFAAEDKQIMWNILSAIKKLICEYLEGKHEQDDAH